MTLDDQTADRWAAGATKPRPRDEAERALVLDQIAALWLGQSQRQIARKLSLNAGTVSGLIMRARRRGDARFPARPDPTPRVKPPPRPRPLKPRDETAGNVRPPKPIPFLLLRLGMCKFPVNAPERGSVGTTMLCCGAPVTRLGASYCVACTAKAKSASGTGARFVRGAIVIAARSR